jgi:hypothetical protein
MIEDYLCTAPDADYIRLALSYLEGGPRSLWTSVYEAYKAAHGRNEPPNPRQFFRETLEANYGLQDLDQKFWDTWNSLKQGPSQDIAQPVQRRVSAGPYGPGRTCDRRAYQDRQVSYWFAARSP